MFEKKSPKKSSGSLLGFAFVAALLGGVGTAVLASKKGTKVKGDLQELGDEIVSVLERVLDKVELQTEKSAATSVEQVSHFITTAYDEMKSLHKAADEEYNPAFGEKISDVVHRDVTKAKEAVHTIQQSVEHVKEEVEHTEDDISQKIAWLQRKGRNLAKQKLMRF